MRIIIFCLTILTYSWTLSGQSVPSEPFRLVNSEYNEMNPVISSDGQTLFVTIANHPENVGGKKDPGDIWISTWTGGMWSAPVHGGQSINDRGYNAVAGISPDGGELYLLSHYDPAGTARTQGIAISSWSGNTWSRPRNISIPYFQNKSTLLSGSLSTDLNVFIFSAETYGTHGVDDLYVCVKENGKWSEPRNLGATINTQFQELTPSIAPDGKTLYFSSNGRKGSGSFDVYSTTRLDETWTSWAAPVNLGENVNSEGRDLYFRDYAALGYSIYTTTRNSDRYGNLRVLPAQRLPLPDSTILATADPEIAVESSVVPSGRDTAAVVSAPVDDEPRKPNAVKLYGKVTDSKSGEPVPATIIFQPADHSSELKASSGSEGYTVEVSSSGAYTVRIEAPGYISSFEKLDIGSYEMSDLEMNFTLQRLEVGTKVNLRSVLFVQTKTELLPESYDELDMVVAFMKQNPTVKIELSGHTDSRGVHADNVRLSEQRVNSVKKYLVSKGIDGKRISGKGYGGTKPIANNDTEETRRMNRRVEFTIRKF